MDIVDKISEVSVDSQGKPFNEVKILKAYII